MAEPSSEPKVLYLIDGHAQFFRAYHAIRPGTMSSPVTREPTNMVFGFVGTLLKLLREHRPHYLAVVIDASGDKETFRSTIYPEYKAHRPEPPDDFRPQVARCLQVLQEMDIPIIAEEGVEADDVIATIARRAERGEFNNVKVRIISRDKDLTQLVSDRVELFDIHKDEVVTPESVFGVPGVTPAMVPDVLALMGDAVDNVPGVPGVGPKTAGQLIVQYGSLDNLLDHLDEIKGKRRENLEQSRDLVRLSRRLVGLKEDCEAPFSLDAARFDPAAIDLPRVQATFRELGFNRHQDDLAAIVNGQGGDSGDKPGAAAAGGAAEPRAAGSSRSSPASSAAAVEEPEHARPPEAGGLFGDSLFADAAKPGAAIIDDHPALAAAARGDYRCLRTAADVSSFVEDIRRTGFVSFDTETDGLSPISANLCGVSLSIAPGTGVYIPVRSPEQGTHLAAAAALDLLRPVLEDPAIAKIGHNMKFDLNVLRTHGVRVRGVAFDTMVASYVIDATRSSHGMDALALAFLRYAPIPITRLIGSGKAQSTFDRAPLPLAAAYAAEDADITLRLRGVFDPMIDAMHLRDLFRDVEMPLVEVLAELEFNGIRVDPVELDRQRDALNGRIADLRRRIIDASPFPFNPDSPRQLAEVLFNRPDQEPPGLGLKVLKRGKTGPSTDVEVLEKLAADPAIDSPVPSLIVEHRQLTKLVNTYLVALKDAINPRTGRVHASFHQTVAATGRLASSDPNLQNIPIRTDVGREIRRAFVADPGGALITADYSQIELRILAHLSGDPGLIDAFRRDMDIHTAVAAEVYRVPPDQVTPAQRSSAKMINFGIVYGITPFGLARRLGGQVTNEEAAAIIADYKHRFSRINEFLDACVHAAERRGYVETILKRRRAIPQVLSRHPQEKALGERMAINSVVQGSAADLIKVAMITLHRELPGAFPRARMLLQIHDELVFEAPRPDAEPLRSFVVDRMEHAMNLVVPLKVGSAIGTSWIDAK